MTSAAAIGSAAPAADTGRRDEDEDEAEEEPERSLCGAVGESSSAGARGSTRRKASLPFK